MKTRFLFPSVFRPIGYLLALPGFILGYLVVYQNYSIPGFAMQIRKAAQLDRPLTENFTNELALMLAITGLVFIAFSKIKKEDELTGKIRLNALYWAVLVNFIWYAAFMLLALINYFIKWPVVDKLLNGFSDNDKFLAYNLVTPLLIFIIRFYYLIYRNNAGYPLPQVKLLKHSPFNLLGKWLSLLVIVIMVCNMAFINTNQIDSIFWGLPLTLLIWLYAKEKSEDEYINALRLDAMQIAIYTNYAILLLSNLLFYGLDFLLIQVVNLVTIPLIFQARFQYRLYRLRRNDAKNGITLSLL